MTDNSELLNLTGEQQAAVREAAGQARKKPGRHTVKIDSGEAYAFAVGGEISWGFRAGPVSLARGVVPL
jgi:hypothetical protein